jgi:Trehalase
MHSIYKMTKLQLHKCSSTRDTDVVVHFFRANCLIFFEVSGWRFNAIVKTGVIALNFAMKFWLISCVALVNSVFVSSEDLPPPCSSEIYCYGRIIDSVMKNHIFNDSKTYVDLKLKKPPNDTLQSFDKFMLTVNNQPSQDQLQKWVEESFDPSGSELENHKPVDHKTNIEVYNRISDNNFKKFASDLNDIWIELSRKMKDEAKVSLRRIEVKEFVNNFIKNRIIRN